MLAQRGPERQETVSKSLAPPKKKTLMKRKVMEESIVTPKSKMNKFSKTVTSSIGSSSGKKLLPSTGAGQSLSTTVVYLD